jgi:hypothetical protein
MKIKYDQEQLATIIDWKKNTVNKVGSKAFFCGFTHAHSQYINIKGEKDYDIPGAM